MRDLFEADVLNAYKAEVISSINEISLAAPKARLYYKEQFENVIELIQNDFTARTQRRDKIAEVIAALVKDDVEAVVQFYFLRLENAQTGGS